MILASQFGNFSDPLIALSSLPFGLVGALLALKILGESLNIYSFMGVVLLMGLVKKNSILLVEFGTQRRGAGLSPRQAILEACPIRLRPIVMTTVATIAGSFPALFAMGPGSETRIPMAATVVGGIIFSTLLTLFILPCAYAVFHRVFQATAFKRPAK